MGRKIELSSEEKRICKYLRTIVTLSEKIKQEREDILNVRGFHLVANQKFPRFLRVIFPRCLIRGRGKRRHDGQFYGSDLPYRLATVFHIYDK
jgi:hypothetical protein